VYKFDKFVLTCISATPPIWNKGGKQLNVNYESTSVGQDRYDYIVERAEEEHSGNYSCSGVNSEEMPFTSNAEVWVGSKYFF